MSLASAYISTVFQFLRRDTISMVWPRLSTGAPDVESKQCPFMCSSGTRIIESGLSRCCIVIHCKHGHRRETRGSGDGIMLFQRHGNVALLLGPLSLRSADAVSTPLTIPASINIEECCMNQASEGRVATLDERVGNQMRAGGGPWGLPFCTEVEVSETAISC